MKSILVLAILLIGVNAQAARNQRWACLEDVGTIEAFKQVTTIFHKVTITEQRDGQLRGNYTLNPKSMMNYASIDVFANGTDDSYASRQANDSIGDFVLKISDEEISKEVVVSKSIDGEIYSAGLLRGQRAYLKVTRLYDGKTQETRNLICNRNPRKLFTENK